MIKVKGSIATREPIPAFLSGLAPESLLDLSWTDPALGVSDAAWWPEEDQSPALGEFERYGGETLTPDIERRVVVVTRDIVPWSQEEIAEYQAQQRAAWITEIADRRFQAETGGMIYQGMMLATDRESQSLITGAAVSAMLDEAYTVRWKTADGFVELTAEQIIGVATAVRAHVQACFDREAELLAEVEAGTLTPEMLDEGWPNGSVPASPAG